MPPTRLLLLLPCALTACTDEPGPPAAPPPPEIRLEAPVTGELSAGDSVVGGSVEDRWTLNLAAGRRVYLTLRADSFDAELRLRGPDGVLAAVNRDALGRDAAIMFRALTSGPHTVAVRSTRDSLARGAYQLAAVALSDSLPGPGIARTLTVGDSVTGVLEYGDSMTAAARGYDRPDRLRGLVDYYHFRSDSNGWVVIEMRAPLFDAYVAAGDSSGWNGMADDDGAGGTDARLTWPVEAGRHYSVAAASFGADRAPGTYTLTIRPVARPRATRETEGSRGNIRPLTLLTPEARACQGKSMRHAPPYDRSRRQSHAMSVVSSTATIAADSAPDPSTIELILCLERTASVMQVCHYMGPSITRRRYRWTARLIEARTLRLLAEESVQGDMPRACGYSEAWSLTEITGSHGWYGEALNDLRPRLARWVQHAAADSTMPGLPRRVATAARGRGGKGEPNPKLK